VFIRVYRLEIQSVMLVFSAQLCELLPPNLLWFNPTPFPVSKNSIYKQCVARWGVLSPVEDHILQELNTLYLSKFFLDREKGTYKIIRPPQTIT
jgi:hypothetical protein